MSVHPESVSVVDPISPALKRVKVILFAPFDLGKWFIIGFCAFLSSCGESGGGGNGGGNFGNGKSMQGQDFQQGWESIKHYIQDNLNWLIPVVILVFLVGIALWLLVLWLNSRGKFMFLDCVAKNRAEIKSSWEQFAAHARSLFLFRIVLGLAAFVIIAPILVGSIILLLSGIFVQEPNVERIVPAVLGILVAIGIGLVFGVIKKLLQDFVVPIMYRRTSSVTEAWHEFAALASENRLRFVGYILFSVLISMVIGTGILLLGLVTCCTAFCLMAIPYIGTVLLLPVFVFQRAYSLYYFEQYGPDYTLIEE